MALACLTLHRLIHGSSWLDIMWQGIHHSSALNSNSKYNILLKAPPVLMYTKRQQLGACLEIRKYKTLMLYLSLDIPLVQHFYTYTLAEVL